MTADWRGIAAKVVLVALFIGAAVFNAVPWLMGSPASLREVAVTLVALAAWPVYGVWMGRRRAVPVHLWRFPLAFWSTVVVAAIGGSYALTAGTGSIVDGPLSMPGAVAVFLSTAPFYGLTRPPNINEPLFNLGAVVVVSAVVLGVSVMAQVLSRRAATRTPISKTEEPPL